ncbi:lysosomal proton-coupled steroid conjugate and bile acid symporter SLC46A3-like [Culicoides brevitarsis]|uniref:lysosomal proton-coupled steroid conjugate and bile acid symporter SLC46A3-like n=1 Tax=Culicoides brevitarsis TaxID=469753 RepID=UPI00307C754E
MFSNSFNYQRKDLLAKLWRIRGHLKIEFITIFFLCPAYFGVIAYSTFELQKACHVNLKIDAETCDQLNNVRYKEICTLIHNYDDVPAANASIGDIFHFVTIVEGRNDVEIDELSKILKVCDAERDSQKLISKTYSIRAPIATSLTLLIVIFAGSWSDKHDIRKVFILFSFIGEIIGTIIYILSAVFYDEMPIDLTIYVSSICMSLFGGKSLYGVGIDSYLAITTTEDYRTFRIGFFSMFRTALGIFASPLGGIFFDILSYKQLFTVNLFTQIIGIVTVILWLPDVKAKNAPSQSNVNGNVDAKTKNEPSVDLPVMEMQKKRNFCADFFDPSHIKDSITVLKVPRPSNKRKILLFVVLLNAVICATFGEDELYILYCRKALNWTTEFSIFVSYYTVIGILGTGIATLVFSKCLRMSDPVMAMISIAGSIAANPILAFAHSTFMAYVGVTVDFFYYVRYFIIKSMISKLVDGNEIGRVFSLLGITENLDSIIFVPIYAVIYYHTLDILPGAFFLFSNIFLLIAFGILIYLRYLYRKSDSKPTEES